ncbi:hypothetical protein Celaphus_00004878 [Cervus elaphus hippelaphus]|uniref:Uncharacterized protein n=1 Tax=Cervus elaphus hippelaphus TaxID=46360 RepID=A0A212DCG0_CEREH|nr:hypothetical protein Celaphus_00004878 [Cervus elaphus hippelaphus]
MQPRPAWPAQQTLQDKLGFGRHEQAGPFQGANNKVPEGRQKQEDNEQDAQFPAWLGLPGAQWPYTAPKPSGDGAPAQRTTSPNLLTQVQGAVPKASPDPG